MKCHVKGCKSKCRSYGISFYRFTKTTSPHIKEAWRKFCGNLPDHAMPMVCARHFQSSDFCGTNMYGKSLLKRDAVPSIKPEEDERCFVFQDNEDELEFQLEEGMDLPENVLLVNEEGEQYILSDSVGQDDETPTLILAGGADGEELLLDEEEFYVLEDHPMEVFEDIPPLMTFDGRLVTQMDSGNREVALVREALAMETAPESPPTDFHKFVGNHSCSHKTEHEKNLKIIKRLEKETRNLSAEIDVLASTKRRMRSEIGRVQKSFGCMFTANQMDWIQGLTGPWQKKDFHRAVTLKLLGPKAYRFLREKYKFPLPSLSRVNSYEQIQKEELTLVYDEVKAVKAMVRNMKSQNKD